MVGGGLVGLSTAYWLARHGQSPLLLEAGNLAARASGRNAGFLLSGVAQVVERLGRPQERDGLLDFWRATIANRELLRRELIDPGRVDCDFLPEGSWLATVGDPSALQQACETLRGEGLDLDWRGAEAAYAASGSRAILGGIFTARDGGLHPVKLCHGMAEAGGFAVECGFRVRSLEARGDRALLVSEGRSVIAERVVLTLNAYAPRVLPQLASAVRPVRGQILATAPGERFLQGVWYLNDGFEYVRQLADGTLLVGGRRLAAEADERGYAETPTATVQGALEEVLRELFPGCGDRPIVQRWAGTMAFTPNCLPCIGRLDHLPAVTYGVGFNGHGLSLGFLAGRHLALQALEQAGDPDFLPLTRYG